MLLIRAHSVVSTAASACLCGMRSLSALVGDADELLWMDCGGGGQGCQALLLTASGSLAQLQV